MIAVRQHVSKVLQAVTRAKLFKNWLESEFEIVNTTFLSDLDY